VGILRRLFVENMAARLAELAEEEGRKVRSALVGLLVAAVILLAALGLLLGAMGIFVFALYALLQPELGIAGSAAIAGVVALLLAVCLAAAARSAAKK
jgi:hypothetical protein